MLKKIIFLFSFILSLNAQAFTCYMTVVKDTCWLDYNVTVSLTNTKNQKVSVTVPTQEQWGRTKFECEPQETFSGKAQFNPALWEKDAGKFYTAVRDWALPMEVTKNEVAWNIPICYPRDFAGVPIPLNASNNCTCEMNKIPPIKP